MALLIALYNHIKNYTFKEFKNIRNLETNKEHELERFDKVKMKFGP